MPMVVSKIGEVGKVGQVAAKIITDGECLVVGADVFTRKVRSDRFIVVIVVSNMGC